MSLSFDLVTTTYARRSPIDKPQKYGKRSAGHESHLHIQGIYCFIIEVDSHSRVVHDVH